MGSESEGLGSKEFLNNSNQTGETKNLNKFKRSLHNLDPDHKHELPSHLPRADNDSSTKTAKRRAEQIPRSLGGDAIERDEEWEKEKLWSPDVLNTYKTAFLGASPDIAYYLESAKDKIDPRTSIIIGVAQPWVRDCGSPYLTSSTIMNGRLVKREDFSQLVENVIETSKIDRKHEQVMKVEKYKGWYKITYGSEGNNPIYVKEVVVGMGAKHTPRGFDARQIARNEEEAKEKR